MAGAVIKFYTRARNRKLREIPRLLQTRGERKGPQQGDVDTPRSTIWRRRGREENVQIIVKNVAGWIFGRADNCGKHD